MSDSEMLSGEHNGSNEATNAPLIRPIFTPFILCPLVNLCNTCYFNAGVQLLSNCPSFVFSLRSSPSRHPIHRHRTQRLSRKDGVVSQDFFHAFAQLLHDMEFASLPLGEALSPLQTLDCLAAVHPSFEGRGQQDCTEMITVVIAAVAEEDRQVAELEPLLLSFSDDAGKGEHARESNSGEDPIDGLAAWSREEEMSMDSLSNGFADYWRFPGSWWVHKKLRFMRVVNGANEMVDRKVRAKRQQLSGCFQRPKLFYSSTTNCFKGYMLSEILCHTCGTTSRTIQEFSSLLLEIPTGRQRMKYARLHPEVQRVAADGSPLQQIQNASGYWWNPLSWVFSAARRAYSFLTGLNELTNLPITLQECIDIHFEPVLLKGANEYDCASCGNKSEATKKETLLSLPEFLFINMKRFEHGQCFNTKKTEAVVFPLSWDSGRADISQTLSLGRYLHESVASPPGFTPTESAAKPNGILRDTSYTDTVGNMGSNSEPNGSIKPEVRSSGQVHEDGGDQEMDSRDKDHHRRDDGEEGAATMPPQQPIHTYTLEAVVNHHGSFSGGHYTAFARKCAEGRDTWVYISDKDISTVDVSEVADSEEYMLLYKKQPLLPRCSTFLHLREKAKQLLSRADPGAKSDALGTRFEGGEYVYISRSWLQQMAFFEEPGPILNQLCYCTDAQRQKPTKPHHGNVHTHGPPVEWFYVPLLRTEFDAFHRAYGGNAAVTGAEYDKLWEAQEAACTQTQSLW